MSTLLERLGATTLREFLPSVAALVLANLVPLVGVFVWGWEVFPLVLLFWCENVIVGVFNALKMLLAQPQERLGWLMKVFLIPFFCFHYGMFTLVHGVFVAGFFGGAFRSGAPPPDLTFFWDAIVQHHLTWAVAGLVVSHGFSFGVNYIGRGEYQRAQVRDLMAQPYGRVVVLHLAILGGGFLMALLGSPAAGLALLVALKIVLDVRAHLRERQKLARPPKTASPNQT
ncbi:MAG: DUF6498-containing protein [Verrucomicrobiae bacterium]|nr:DUF6498-containing protein [Verrucomicrobiae bacterium]